MNKIANIITSALIAVSAAIPLATYAEQRPPETENYGFLKLDMNYDGIIDAIDASIILSEYARISVGEPYSFSVTKRCIADYDGNSKIDAVDASAALKSYAYNSSHSDKYEQRYLFFSVSYSANGQYSLTNECCTFEESLKLIEDFKTKINNNEISYIDVNAYDIWLTNVDGMQRSQQQLYEERLTNPWKGTYYYGLAQ